MLAVTAGKNRDSHMWGIGLENASLFGRQFGNHMLGPLQQMYLSIKRMSSLQCYL